MIVCTNSPGQTPPAYQNRDTTHPDTAPTFVPASISTFLTWFPDEMRLRWLCFPPDTFFPDGFQTLCPMSEKSDWWSSPTWENQGKEHNFQEVASSVCQWALGQVSEEIFPSYKRIQLGNLILNALGAVVHVELRKELKLVRLLKYWQKFTMGKSALIYFRGCCLYVYYIYKNQRDMRAKFCFDFPPNVPFEEDRSSFQVSFT